MVDINFTLRMNKQEKSVLSKISKKLDMTITDYIKQRLFLSNPDITDQKFVYETAINAKHDYLTMGMLQEVYFMLKWLVKDHLENQLEDDEEVQELLSSFHRAAKESVAKNGYLRVEASE
ncbi:hypothetical protein NOVO_09185 (plasmid) [Rickettsiales bacterium Ac37b]|nr:hypothetical protein NOVO_09185 [Rickettsiales bacterium Ac37b]